MLKIQIPGPHPVLPIHVVWSPQIYLFLKLWTPRRKIHLIWIPRRNLSTEMDSPWLTESPSCVNSKSLVAICWRACTLCTRKNLRLTSQLPALCLDCLPVSTTARKPWFPLSTCRLRPALSNQNCTIRLSHLCKVDLIGRVGTFTVHGDLPFILVEHSLNCYLNLPLRLQLRLLKLMLFFIPV